MAGWNPIRAYEDSKKRKAMKENLLQLCRMKLLRNSDMLQLGNASIDTKFVLLNDSSNGHRVKPTLMPVSNSSQQR